MLLPHSLPDSNKWQLRELYCQICYHHISWCSLIFFFFFFPTSNFSCSLFHDKLPLSTTCAIKSLSLHCERNSLVCILNPCAPSVIIGVSFGKKIWAKSTSTLNPQKIIWWVSLNFFVITVWVHALKTDQNSKYWNIYV